MFRFGVRRTVRNWKLTLAIFIGIFLASSLFASINIQANAIQESLLNEVLADLPTDIIWHRTRGGGYDLEIPDRTALFQWRTAIQSITHVDEASIFVVHDPPTISVPGDMFYTTAISQNSSLYEEITVISGTPSLGVNETYIATSSTRFNDFPIGSNHTIHFVGEHSSDLILNATLRIAGHVDITEKAEWLLSGFRWYFYPEFWGFPSFFIVDLDQTFIPLLEQYRLLRPDTPNLRIHIGVDLDRDAILRPYNIEESITQIFRIANQIRARLPFPEIYIENLLGEQLIMFQDIVSIQRQDFFLLAMPVLFVTLYLGVTLSDITFSLRRREIGLLLSKGGTHRQLTVLYLLEALIIGIAAGFCGILIALTVIPLFMGIGSILLLAPSMIGFDTILLILAFAIILSILSIFIPTRKALKVPMAEVLREYSFTSEVTQYHEKFAWLCLILGTYKLLTWIFGLNTYLIHATFRSGNVFLHALRDNWLAFDILLGLIAPLLFTYGFVMIVIKGSPWISKYATRLQQRLFGDLGAISAHNIQRRPGRTAAVIFLIALFVGFSIQSIGYQVTFEDWITRRIYTEVGADISVKIQHPDNVTTLLPIIRGYKGVQGATAQYVLSMQIGESTNFELRAINPDKWLHVAYFEESWFPLGSAESTIRSLNSVGKGIVLERLRAANFGKTIGSSIEIQIWPNRSFQEFIVTGFFGPEPIDISHTDYHSYNAEWTWSYTTANIIDTLGSSSGYECYILIRLTSNAANAEVMNTLSVLEGVTETSSAINTLAGYRTNIFLYSQTSMTQLVVFFGFILTTTGTFVVHYLVLFERRRVTALMSQRGSSYRQMVTILAGEILIISAFAILIGLIVGFISYYGVIQGADYTWPFPIPLLIPHQFLPVTSIPLIVGQLGVLIGFLLGLPLILILIEAKRARSDISALG